MKKTLLLIAALFTALSALRADTSYLLIQGPFGPSEAVQTYLWKVLYQPGSLTTSQDLLDAVFGPMVNQNTTHFDTYGTPRPYWEAGNSTLGAGYQFFASFPGFLVESFTIGGVSVVIDGGGTPAWTQYLAGGGGYPPPDYEAGPYPNNIWTGSGDLLTTRTLSDGSFDGWVFGDAYPLPSAEIAGGDDAYAPTAANFASATVITVVPEPGSALLLLAGLSGLALRRRR
jgi:hypothetical protein